MDRKIQMKIGLITIVLFCISMFSGCWPNGGQKVVEKNVIENINASNDDLIDLSIEFGPHGEWDGNIKLTDGKIVKAAVLPLNSGADIAEKGDDFVKLKGSSEFGMSGVRLLVSNNPDAILNINFKSISMTARVSDVLKKNIVTRTAKAKDSRYPDVGIAVRRSDYKPERYAGYDMPVEKYAAAAPKDVIRISGNGSALGNQRHSLEIELDRESPENIDYRRLPSGTSDRMILQIFTGDPDDDKNKNNEFSVKQVKFKEETQQFKRSPSNSVYLDMPAFIGYYDIRVGSRDKWSELTVPASSIVLDGPKLLLNGYQFMAKGSLIQWGTSKREVQPTAVTSFLMKNMGINTVSSPPSSFYEPWGFASIRRAEELTILKKEVQEYSDKEYIAKRDELVKKVPKSYNEYISSPFDIASFFSNETTNKGNGWANYTADFDQYGRLNSYLAYMYNAAKKMSPMMPVSYANHMPWFRPSPWLDIIMFNSYYTVDRFALPYSEFAKWQGFPAKPIYNKEFSSNTYLEEIYQGGRNNPVFGKIRQWAFDKRWQEYLSIGSLGGGIYANFDYNEGQEEVDGNTTSFGVFTVNQEPKQIAYSVWQEYTDLVFHEDGTIENRRSYPLRNVELLIYSEDGAHLEQFDILEAGQKKQQQLPQQFYWTAQFDTHNGILNQQSGAYPEALFRDMFKALLPEDESKPFAEQLLDTDIIGWNGQTDDYLMGKFKNGNVISVAFQKAPGEYYLTAWVQADPNAGKKSESHTLTFFDTGDVRVLDDISGEPKENDLKYEEKDGKLVFRNMELPIIGRSIEQRSKTPIHLPVIQVSKSGFITQKSEIFSLSDAPDQFQLWHNGSVSFGDGLTEAISQRFGSLYGSLGSLIVMPMPDTGSLQGDISVRLYITGQDGLPSEQIAERKIAGDEWKWYEGKPLSIDFGVELNKESNYLVTFSSGGDKDNHRNLATSGMNRSAVTPSYGGGEAFTLQNGEWQSIADRKDSIFFITTAK